MIKNKSTLILILSILTMTISVGALIFFYHVIKNKNTHTEAVTEALQEKIVEKANSVALQEESTKFEGIQNKVNGYFVDPSKIDSFVNYMEGLGASAGGEVKVENFDVSTTLKNTLTVRVTTKGTFSNVMRVLMLIENSPYKIHIINTTFNHADATATVTNAPAKTAAVGSWEGDISFTILLAS